jgi:quercetin dioxygenase-like cupin family protein
MLNRCHRLILFLAAAVPVAGNEAALGQADGAAGSRQGVIAESRFVVTDPPVQAELVQLVVDFVPGAWTSLHTHGGQATNLVLEGEITFRHGGVDRVYRAGQAWTDSTRMLHAAGNTGAGNARLMTNFLLPKGAPQTIAQESSRLEPTVLYEARHPLPALPAQAEIVQQVVDLPAGGRWERAHRGSAATLVISGEVTAGTAAEQKPHRAGEAWAAPADAAIVAENRSAAPARLFTTYLVPQRIP